VSTYFSADLVMVKIKKTQQSQLLLDCILQNFCWRICTKTWFLS